MFYGWNYSGKTTISRVFRCFELGEKHIDYPNAEFELEDDQNPRKKYNEKNLSILPHVRVFNTDFISENLKWYSQNDEGIEPIFFSIGKENIELQEKLEKFKADEKLLSDEKMRLAGKKDEIENNLGNKLTNEARNITKTLSLGRNYEKPQFRQDIDSIKDDFAGYILSDDIYDKYLTTYKNTEQKDDVVLSALPALNFFDLQSKAKEIIERKITAQKIIEDLKNNNILNKWVSEGRGLHKGKDKCLFCGNNLPSNLLQILDQHFSAEYEQTEKDIENLSVSVGISKITISAFVLPAKGEFYKEFIYEYEKLQKEFNILIKKYRENIDELSKDLKAKKANPFDAHKFTDIYDNSNDVKNKYEEIKSIVKKHKSKTENFEKEKNESKEKMIKHFSAQFIQDQKYLDILKEQKEVVVKIVVNKTGLDKAVNDIIGVEKQLSESVKGAEKVNEYIQQFFQHDGIKIEVTEDNRFKMSRNNEPAKNLSEGERTAISFAYFIAGLEDKKTKLDETLVFIDDPVSSLDCNHLFNIYAFIKSKLINCGQLFVSTHNLEFFNLMKDFLMEVKDQNNKSLYGNKKELPCYLVQKQWNKITNQSMILDLPKELKYFKSEYVYLFSIMLDFDKEKNGTDFKMLYLLPNVERRFLEGYLGLRYPDRRPWKEKFVKLVENETQRNLVYKFVNEFSHNQSTTRSLKFPEASECKQSLDIIIDGLKTSDKGHYDALCESCN